MKTKLTFATNVKVGRVTPCAPQHCNRTAARRGLTRPTILRRAALLLSTFTTFYVAQLSTVFAQGTTFTYQGRLNDSASPATGIYDFRFTIYDALSSGSTVAGPLTNAATAVSSGLFTVALDFGASVFTGPDRWLEIGVCTNGGGPFTTLNPRQRLTATPYAVTAGTVTGPINGGSIINGSITGTQLANGTVTAANLASNSITAGQLASGAAAGNLQANGQSAVPGGGMILSSNSNDTALANAGYVKLGKIEMGDFWEQKGQFEPAPDRRADHTVIWTGGEMIVWGGHNDADLNSGGRYNPAANSWSAISLSNAPAGRRNHTAVWTGTEMIVWGGLNAVGNLFSGGRYNPAANTWTATVNFPIPSRHNHSAVWTGSEMIIWGGSGSSGSLTSGARYNPVSNSWANVSTTNAPAARSSHTAIWTGNEMIVWGGASSGSNYLNDGGRYNPAADSWTAAATSGAPAARASHTAVWTGTEMIVWGGVSNLTYYSDGGRYSPATNSWTATLTDGAPAARFGHTAVWTGGEMIIWGGATATGNSNDGGRYNPSSNNWSAVSVANAPVARAGHTAVWTGNQMIVWGGQGGDYFNDGGRYDPAANSWTGAAIGNFIPASRSGYTAVWTGTEMIVWGGQSSLVQFVLLNDGGRYNPAADAWTPTSIINAPAGRELHTAIWTGTEMIVWGGGPDTNNNVFGDGARYNPVADSWTPVASANAPVARTGHTAVWSGTEMIVWGGDFTYPILTYLNSGGRYNPATDSWKTNSTSGAPTARSGHSTIWSGTEMIVWGGRDVNGSPLNSGGRYSPASNAWTAVTNAGAPAARISHTAVWTGNEMIVWGGSGNFVYNDGGRYNPTNNTWTATTTNGAPVVRSGHTAVWTGTEMIVWGGIGNEYIDGTPVLKNGGRYSPVANSWTTTTTNGAPTARLGHTAVWSGNDMIVWGGGGGLVSGGHYNPATDSWRASQVPALIARNHHTAVWTGTEMIVWGGNGPDYGTLNSGAGYNPAANSWSVLTLGGAPGPRGEHTAVWTGTEMIVWGGWDQGYIDSTALGDGGRYNPTTRSWTAINTNSAPRARGEHTAVWTGNEMIVWGGSAMSNFTALYFGDGGRYNPMADAWTATPTNGAPSGRTAHTAVWTGSEMIIWGGRDDVNYSGLNSGGRYNPSSNSWATTSPIGAPDPRNGHTAVWTGGEMIVWGGVSGLSGFNSGGRYNPIVNFWSPTPTSGAPVGRSRHSAVWTGNAMVVWGGEAYIPFGSTNAYFNDGGQFDPAANTWTATTALEAPSSRSGHTAVWTGNQMLVWGGFFYYYDGLANTSAFFDTLFAYTPTRTSYLYLRP